MGTHPDKIRSPRRDRPGQYEPVADTNKTLWPSSSKLPVLTLVFSSAQEQQEWNLRVIPSVHSISGSNSTRTDDRQERMDIISIKEKTGKFVAPRRETSLLACHAAVPVCMGIQVFV